MNYSDKSKSPAAFLFFESDDLKVLRVILTELLDEKFALRQADQVAGATAAPVDDVDNEANINEYMNQLWKQDFCPVATLLLKRLMEEF